MSTRSYVGLIEDGKVKYGYHHSDSYLEGLGIELYNAIKNKDDISKLPNYANIYDLDEDDTDCGTVSINSFFTSTVREPSIEFCYGFNAEEGTWYVSSHHFKDKSKVFKLEEVVQDDEQMASYLTMYYEQYRKGILEQIRTNIRKEK